MPLPGRSGASESGYRYSFQGQEKDDEIKGDGNSINYKYRMHDPRVGRFFAVDPLASEYPHYTPYSFSGNKVISHIELEGLEEYEYILQLDDDGEVCLKLLKQSDDAWMFDYISVGVPGVGVYSFHRIADATNFWDDFEEFQKDPIAAILSGKFKTEAEIMNPTDVAVDLIIGIGLRYVRKGFALPQMAKNAPAWLVNVQAGIKFQQNKINQLRKSGADFKEGVTLVPQNEKGNVKGNRTVTDALIRTDDGKGGYIYTINEYKLNKGTKLTTGQKAAQKHVGSEGGTFEIRSDIPDWGLKAGDVINVNKYQVETGGN